jgi:dTDP-4-dehydrorhamnose 3,5-epimerase
MDTVPICGNCFAKSFSKNTAVQAIDSGMKVTQTTLPGVLLLEPSVFTDSRGFFVESYNKRTMAEAGIVDEFVQDNHSFSGRNVLRGLHYQIRHAQGKLVRAVSGEIFDVAVDLRRSSTTFGQWLGEMLSGENKRMLWIPRGLAHGFVVVSENAHVLYKASDYYDAASERTLAWNDSDLNIDWQLGAAIPIISEKDKQGSPFRSAEVFN